MYYNHYYNLLFASESRAFSGPPTWWAIDFQLVLNGINTQMPGISLMGSMWIVK